MKLNKLYVLALVLSVILPACDDQEQRYDQQRDPTSPILTIEGTVKLVVTDDLSTGFYGSVLNWTRANYGKGISAVYTVEVSDHESFMDSKVSEIIGNDVYMKAISIDQLIKWATETFGKQDAETGKWNPVTLFFRVVAGAPDAASSKTATSNVATIDVSWYEKEPVIEELIIGFKVISATDEWNEFAVYAWGARDVYGNWPGKVLEANDDGWYSFTVPTDRPINLIINNNNSGRQFNFLQNPTVGVCYEFVIGEGNDNCDWTEVNCPDLTKYPSEMYMIGQDFGGWNWASDDVAVMTPVNGYEGNFWTIRYITAGHGFKWSSARSWGSDFNTLGEDAGFTLSDGNAVVDRDGLYTVYIDMPNGKISVEPAKVFGMGDCFGSWDTGKYPFTVVENKMEISTTAAGDLRMYANSDIAPIGGDWWRMEFIVLDGKIAYRGNGGDQTRVPVAAGGKVTLDFNAGTGTIQ